MWGAAHILTAPTFSMSMDSLDPASATATDLLQSVGVPVQSVSYKAGLVQPFTGSSTLTPPTVLGSGLPLRDTSDETAISDFIESLDPEAAQNLSGVSTPPFASAYQSMPNPNASPMGDTATNAMSALTKFGASLAIMIGLHPVQQKNVTGLPSNQIAPQSFEVSGAQVAIMGIVAAALIILLLKQKEA